MTSPDPTPILRAFRKDWEARAEVGFASSASNVVLELLVDLFDRLGIVPDEEADTEPDALKPEEGGETAL